MNVTLQGGKREYLLYSMLLLISQTLKRMRSSIWLTPACNGCDLPERIQVRVFCVLVFTALSCLLLWPFVIKSPQKQFWFFDFFCAIDAVWAMDEALRRQQARFAFTQGKMLPSE